ncbi:MAG: Crp/Fnr family transcriptional regulator [Bacteroidia bacterium]
MEPFFQTIRQMIAISDQEISAFAEGCIRKSFRKNALLGEPGKVPEEIFFILKGMVRVIVSDIKGEEHTVHFALENQFIADYSAFMQKIPSVYSLQAIEPLEVVVLPRNIIEWGYANLSQGDRLGRLVAEFYFVYHDNRIKNMYARTPKERYDTITQVFPNIHNRAPQHMIASYLGITPVHLSRLKKGALGKT